MRKPIQLIGYRSRGGRAIIHSPSNVEIFPKNAQHADRVPSKCSSVSEAIQALRDLAQLSPYKSTKVTPIYSR